MIAVQMALAMKVNALVKKAGALRTVL